MVSPPHQICTKLDVTKFGPKVQLRGRVVVNQGSMLRRKLAVAHWNCFPGELFGPRYARHNRQIPFPLPFPPPFHIFITLWSENLHYRGASPCKNDPMPSLSRANPVRWPARS